MGAKLKNVKKINFLSICYKKLPLRQNAHVEAVQGYTIAGSLFSNS